MCGVIGVISEEPKLTLKELTEGLYYLRRRGQDSCAAALINPEDRRFNREYAISTAGFFYRELNSRFQKHSIDDCFIGMGHTRYRTQGEFGIDNLHPIFVYYAENNEEVLIAHNGDVDKGQEVFRSLRIQTRSFIDENRHHEVRATADTRMIADLYIQKKAEGLNATDAIKFIIENVNGSFACLLYDKKENAFFAFRDRLGIRPLYLAEKKGLKIFISETGFLNGRDYYQDLKIREVNPGEILTYKRGELSSVQAQNALQHAHCWFEAVYIMDTFSRVMGIEDESVKQARRRITDFFFEYYKDDIMQAQLDLIVPSMFSGFAYGQRLAHLSRVELSDDMRKSRSVIDNIAETLRNFIQPEGYRKRPIDFNDLAIRKKRVGCTDDSIMRMDTITQTCFNFQQAGGEYLDFYVMSPPNHSGCKYGVATPTNEELVADVLVKEGLIPLNTLEYSKDFEKMRQINQRVTQLVQENIRKVHGVEFKNLRVLYLPPHLLPQAIGIKDICTACVTRTYPV